MELGLGVALGLCLKDREGGPLGIAPQASWVWQARICDAQPEFSSQSAAYLITVVSVEPLRASGCRRS